MKFDNKFIDHCFRFILHVIPFGIGIYLMVCYMKVGADGYTALNGFITDFNGYFTNLPFFSGFSSWIDDNLTHGVELFNFVFNYAFYIVVCEFAILFKNVLTWLFKVANAFLERGVNAGR